MGWAEVEGEGGIVFCARIRKTRRVTANVSEVNPARGEMGLGLGRRSREKNEEYECLFENQGNEAN